jgi:type I restriction enzyme S subunit
MQSGPGVLFGSALANDWPTVSLGSISRKIGSGLTPTGGARVYKSEGFPLVRSQNVGWGSLIVDDLAYIDEPTHLAMSNSELQDNDVLLNITGASIGRCAMVTTEVCGGNVNQHVCIIRVNREDASPSFLIHCLLSELGQRQIDSFQAGSNREGLNFGQVKSILIPLPKIQEQRKIAEVLDDVDGSITSLNSLITKKRNLKNGVAQELLSGSSRLPGFQSAWRTTSLNELGEGIRGVGYNPARDLLSGDRDGAVHLLRSNNIADDAINLGDVQRVRRSVVREDQLLRLGDVVICGANGSKRLVGKAGFFTISDGLLYTFGAFMNCFRPDSRKSCPAFVGHLLHSTRYREQVALAIAGSSINNLSVKQIVEFTFSLPDAEEQRAIAEVLTDMDAEIQTLEQRLVKTRNLKQGMAQELLSGRTRLV